METAGEGGAWGIALLASYVVNNAQKRDLPAYLEEVVFAGNTGESVSPTPEETAGFNAWLDNYRALFPVEEAAVRHKR